MRVSAFILIACLAATAGAQTIAGRVVDRGTTQPIGGVVVSGIGATGDQVIARSVSDRINGYRIAIRPGMTALTFRRIGYAPMRVALSDAVNGRIDIAMTRLPTQLPPMKAITSAVCDKRADREQALALWEEARSGLLTSIVARESRMGSLSVLAYQHGIEWDKDLPQRVERVELTAASHAFFAGGDPDSLAKNGYLERVGWNTSFLGPDDVVLFDDSFFSTHCFSLEPPAADDDSTLGLHFKPGRGRSVTDVEGTLWLRKDPLDLKSVEFRYVNFPRALGRAKPGGSIEFRQMPNGITMIHRWSIRGGGSPPATASITGAVIELMQWPDAPPYFATLGAVSGIAREKGTDRLLRNTEVRLNGTPFTGMTDSTGAFRIMDVLPGVYTMDLGDPVLELHGVAPRAPTPLRVAAGENDFGPVDVDNGAEIVKRACKDDEGGRVRLPENLGDAAVLGALIDSAGVPVSRSFTVEVRPAGLPADSASITAKGRTDRFGRFKVCGVPPDGTVTFASDSSRTLVGRGELTFDSVTTRESPFQVIVIKLAPKPGSQPPPALPEGGR
jgi:hypothetical protein